MVKININIPFGGKHEIYIPTLRLHKSKLEKFSFTLYLINQFSYLAFIFFLPLSVYLYPNQAIETSIFMYLIFGLLILLGMYLANVALVGKKILVDPKGFVPVLVFAFLVTTAAITVTPPTQRNTFGIDDIRSMAGIFSMAMVVFFYLTAVFVRDKKFTNKVLSAFVLGTLLLAYSLIFEDTKLEHTLIFAMGIPIALALAFYRKTVNYVYVLVAVLFGLLIIDSKLLVRDGFENIFDPAFIPLTVLILIALVSYLVILWLLAVLKRHVLAKFLEEFIDKSLKIKKSSIIKLVIALAFLLILIGGYVYYTNRGVESKPFIKSGLEYVEVSFNNLKDDSSDGLEKVKHMLFGFGGDELNTAGTYLSNSLEVHGFSGIIGLSILVFSGIQFLLKLINYSHKEKLNNRYLYFLLFTFISIVFINLISYTGIYNIFVFWIILSLTFAAEFILKRKEESFIITKQIDFKVAKFSFTDEKKSNVLRVVFSFVIFTITILLVGVISGVIDKI